MTTETFLKLAVLAAILIIALFHPVVSALVLTGVAAWHLQDYKITEMALVQKIVHLTPPAAKAMIVSNIENAKTMIASRVQSTVPSVRLALPAPDAVRDVAPMVDARARESVATRR